MEEFSARVIRVIGKIPPGRVSTYGRVAAAAGKPGAARAVAWILHSCSNKYNLPWQRVVNGRGRISFALGSDAFERQRARLIRDGVEISFEGAVDLNAVGWPAEKKIKAGKKSVRKPRGT